MKKQETALRWLSRTAGKDKLYIGLLVLTQAILGGSGVLYAVLLRDLIDAAVAHSRDGMWRSAV